MGYAQGSRGHRSTWPNGKGTGLRNRRDAGSTPAVDAPTTRRSSADTEHCVPNAEVARSNRAGEAHLEVTRLDEEPVPKTGMGCKALGRSSRPASALVAMVHWSRRRALNSEIGVRFPVATRNAMPGSRAERRPAVTRKAGVRAPPWQHTSLANLLDPMRGNGDTSPTHYPRGTKARCKPDGQRRHLLVSVGSRIDSPVVVIQRTGFEHATLAMRVRLPPTTHTHHPLPARS
jgi:hypothetical protein